MKKGLIVLLSILGLGLILFFWISGAYNKAVALDENVKAKWANVQSTYQRRADLIPNLMKTVKGAAANEKDIYTEVTRLRSGISDEAISSAKTPEELDVIGKQINSALKTAINVTLEAYPQIRSTENFQQFQAQLEGTENRINAARDEYNEIVGSYNTHVRGFITRFALSISGGGFEVKKGFEAKAGSEEAPKVDF